MGASPNDIDALPDLTAGVPAVSLPPGASLVGRVGEEAVLVVRTPDGLRAVQATCPHYGAPLVDGCVHDGRIYCPWHHASFDLTDGTLCRPPALDGLRTWPVEERAGRVVVSDSAPLSVGAAVPPRDRGTVAVVGAGAAGTAAVLALREAGHGGPVLFIDPDPEAPYDRPNLSKDYLAGTAPEEWLPLRSADDWKALDVQRVVDGVRAIRPDEPVLELVSGDAVRFDGLILATGAEPRRLPVPGADGDDVFTLRSLEDCRAIRARARAGARAVVVGAGFLGLEVAAALRSRDVEVDVVAPEAVPLEKLLGPGLGAELQALHEENGVRFHLGSGVRRIGAGHVELDDESSLPADLVIVGIGVEPRLELATEAGLDVDGGVIVDEFLESSRAGIYVAGDIACFPAPWDGRPTRIEHWAVAEAQGRTAALNLLGHERAYRDVPFFWTSQHGVTLQWSGFPGSWDRVEREGSLAGGSLAARFTHEGRPWASVFVGRDRESLVWEVARETEIAEVVR